MSSRLRTLFGGAALLLAATIGLAAPASAEPAPSTTSDTKAQCFKDFRSPGTNIRSLPNTGPDSAVRGQGNPGDCIIEHGSIHGQRIQCPSGSSTDTWFDVTNERTGVRGWVSACHAP